MTCLSRNNKTMKKIKRSSEGDIYIKPQYSNRWCDRSLKKNINRMSFLWSFNKTMCSLLSLDRIEWMAQINIDLKHANFSSSLSWTRNDRFRYSEFLLFLDFLDFHIIYARTCIYSVPLHRHVSYTMVVLMGGVKWRHKIEITKNFMMDWPGWKPCE